MATKKFIEISAAGSIVAGTYFIAVNDQGAGVGVDYRFSLADLAAAISESLPVTRAQITTNGANISTQAYDNDTYTDPFFGTTVTGIVQNGIYYQAGADFSQDTGAEAISWTNMAQWEPDLLFTAIR